MFIVNQKFTVGPIGKLTPQLTRVWRRDRIWRHPYTTVI